MTELVVEDFDQIDTELEKCAYKLDDDLSFPRATIDGKLIRLQKDVVEFVTSVILKHESEFYHLVKDNFPDKLEEILCITNPSIIEMIVKTTTKFYNNIYHDIQNKKIYGLTQIILDMCEFAEYAPHFLLNKLIYLTVDVHLEIPREKLVIQNNDLDLYHKSILIYLNFHLLSHNLLDMFAKTDNENNQFVFPSDGQNAFDIVIDKNIYDVTKR